MMFRTVGREIWAIDAEWVPDAETGRRVYGLDASVPEAEVRRRMWAEAGATQENPRPYLKTILCRVVAVSALIRRRRDDGSVEFDLRSIPGLDAPVLPEADLLLRFMDGVGRGRPQLVGFNLLGADLPILVQRAMVHGISAPDFCARPEKPWQGVDYFTRYSSEDVIDLMDIYGRRGNTPRLHELATAAGIPGKIDVAGDEVVSMWDAGQAREIVEYNRLDVVTTYLIWLRTAHLAGHLSTDRFTDEQRRFEAFLEGRVLAGEAYLSRYLEVWRDLRFDPSG